MVVVQASLTPRDYFEPVDSQTPRSCIPVGGTGFSYLLNANTGRMVLHGPTMFPPVSVAFNINDSSYEVIFSGKVMQLSQIIENEADLDPLLTHCEHTIPALLSLTTGLSVFAETIEVVVGDDLEARSETTIPPNHVRIISADDRVAELRRGLETLGCALPSTRYTLAATYLRDAIFFDAAYNEHNPYYNSLLVILRCAQAVEVLFGGQRDAIREKCRILEIPADVVETSIIPITLARHSLGSAHASAFVPNQRQVTTLRHFATRSIQTVRQVLLHIARAEPEKRTFLIGAVERDREKERLFLVLEESLKAPQWPVAGSLNTRELLFSDPRL